MWSDYPTDVQPNGADSGLPFFKLNNDVQLTKPDMSDPAVAAWQAIIREVPLLGRFKQVVTSVSPIDNVLTVTVPDSHTYTALTFFIACATDPISSRGDELKVEMTGEAESVVIR